MFNEEDIKQGVLPILALLEKGNISLESSQDQMFKYIQGLLVLLSAEKCNCSENGVGKKLATKV